MENKYIIHLCGTDNRCGKSTTDVALELEEAGIITCVVSNGANTFGPLYQYTDGIQMSVYSDFHSYLYDFMTEYLKQMSGFNFVSANSLCSKFLDDSLVRGGSTDTDKDRLTDSEEVDWNCIDVIMNGKEYTSEDGIVIALPTFEQVLGFSNFYDAETYDRISPYYRNAIGNINILPIKSDPTSEDGDNDGILDIKDSKPLETYIPKHIWRSSDEKYSTIIQTEFLKLELAWILSDSYEEKMDLEDRANEIRKELKLGGLKLLDILKSITGAVADEFAWFLGGDYGKSERDYWLYEVIN